MEAKNQQKAKKKIKILVADREGIFRLGLKRLFSAEDDLRVVAQAESAPQVVAMIKSFRPDLVIVQQEIARDGNRNLIAQILHESPGCKIVVTTSLFSEENGKQVVESGASGLISKEDHPEVFVKNVRKVMEGATILPPKPSASTGEGIISDKDRRPRPVDTLTRRERTIISCLTQGCRNREIAEHLAITEQTVKNHLRSIYDKVGVSDRLELVLYAIHQQLELPPVTP
ncbi:MAG: response regulator transcription factor [Acidobacteria bacterium]|nr:response regulator transcription factor [Acidobacteriota bacterium]